MQKKSNIAAATRTKYPEQVVLVTTRGPRGNPNVMPVGWTATVSGDPRMFALAIDKESYTLELIRKTRQFVVAYPHEGMGRQVLHAGSCHGRDRDKIAECRLATQKARIVSAPLLADAVANFECKMVNIYQPGDCPVVVGKVVAAHVNRNPALKRLYAVAPGHVLGGLRRR